MTTKNCKL